MKQLYLTLAGLILFMSVKGQSVNSPNNIVRTYGAPTEMPRQKLDTNTLVFDENGASLRFYQYEKLLNSGEYTITFSGPPGPNTKRFLKKVTPQIRATMYQMMKTQMAIKNSALQVDKELDITPLLDAVSKSELDRKAIVLIFWNPDCPPCTETFESLNDFFKHIQNPQDLIILAITAEDKFVASEKLKQKPLKYARLISNAGMIDDVYNVRNFPSYVVADKDHVIRFAVSGQGPVITPAFKDAISTILIQ